MGSKSTVGKFDDAQVQSSYSSIISSGKALWGSAINFSTTAPGNAGVQNIITSSSTPNTEGPASTQIISINASSGHITQWRMTIYSALFDEKATDMKKKIIAHEIGHVYGLDHLYDASKYTSLMYGGYAGGSSAQTLQQDEILGMNLLTHTHTSHSFPAFTQVVGGNSHRSICSGCKGYREAAHATDYYTWYNSSQHKNVCVCGYTVGYSSHRMSQGTCLDCGGP
nr:matrixin family metalloprotease [bacterium]